MGIFNKSRDKKAAADPFMNEPVPVSTQHIKDRYMMEHEMFPHFILRADGGNLVRQILNEKGSFFVGLYYRLNVNIPGYRCPYTPDRYYVEDIPFDGMYALEIQMPEPENIPLCKSIIIIHDQNMENRRYITVEASSGCYFICEWTADGHHLDYGPYSPEKLLQVMKG